MNTNQDQTYQQFMSCGKKMGMAAKISDEYMCPHVGNANDNDIIPDGYIEPSFKTELRENTSRTTLPFLRASSQAQETVVPTPAPFRSAVQRDTAPITQEQVYNHLQNVISTGVGSIKDHPLYTTFGDVVKNPDFGYSVQMMHAGATGVKDYMVHACRQNNGLSPDIALRLDNILLVLKGIGNQIKSALSEVGDYSVETFLSSLTNPPPAVTKMIGGAVKANMNRLKRDTLYCINKGIEQIGGVNFGSVIEMLYKIGGNKDLHEVINNVSQVGGVVYDIVSSPPEDPDEYSRSVLLLFNQLKLTLDHIMAVLKRQLNHYQAPPPVYNHIDTLHRGALLSLQICRYHLLNNLPGADSGPLTVQPQRCRDKKELTEGFWASVTAKPVTPVPGMASGVGLTPPPPTNTGTARPTIMKTPPAASGGYWATMTPTPTMQQATGSRTGLTQGTFLGNATPGRTGTTPMATRTGTPSGSQMASRTGTPSSSQMATRTGMNAMKASGGGFWA